MMKKGESEILVPMDVPKAVKKTYLRNFNAITGGSGRLMLFAGDQRLEHLNKDFYGKGIHPDDADPEHFFRIASKAKIGAFATQLGLISKYAEDYRNINYIVKLNSKTNIVKTKQKDPFSEQLLDIHQIIKFKNQSNLNICGVGYTLYLGSEYESLMLREAAQLIFDAHQHGLLVILWIYPRGKAVKDEKDPDIIAGATGVACCLGADFAKVNYPERKGKKQKDIFRQAVVSAGRTRVICAGGSSTSPEKFMRTLKDQLDVGAGGNATGRNVHQKGLDEAVRMCNAVYALTIENKTVEEAMAIYKGVM